MESLEFGDLTKIQEKLWNTAVINIIIKQNVLLSCQVKCTCKFALHLHCTFT